MKDPYRNTDDVSAPSVRATAINLASDTTYAASTAVLPRGIYVGTGGTVVVALAGAPTTYVTFQNVQDGTILPIRPAVVRSTANGTTATGLVALF